MDLNEIARRFNVVCNLVSFTPGETREIVEQNPNRFGFAIITAPTDALSDMIYPLVDSNCRFKISDWDSRFEIRADKHPGLNSISWNWYSASGTTKIVLEYLINYG